jgi:hypothetical protein
MTARSAAAWDVRHAFRLHRFELVSVAVLIAALVAACVAMAVALDATGFGACAAFVDQMPIDCEVISRHFFELQEPWGVVLRSLLQAVPFIAAVLLGVPMIARELERGTARLAWSLAPSRGRWFLARLLPVLAAIVAVGITAGVALDGLLGAFDPGLDPQQSFVGFGMRGVVFAARVVCAFAIAVAAGAVMGRSLPALLVAVVLASVVIAGSSFAHGQLLASEAILVADGTGIDSGSLYIDQRLQDAAGNVMTWDQAYELMPSDDTAVWPPADWTFVSLVVPASHLPVATAREVVAFGVAAIAFLCVAAAAVARRRPG